MRCALLALLPALVALAGPVAAPADTAAPTPAQPSAQPSAGPVTPSDERALSRWAHPRERAPIRVSPHSHAHVIARLRPFTEDGLPEVYLLLAQVTGADGQTWARRPTVRTRFGTADYSVLADWAAEA